MIFNRLGINLRNTALRNSLIRNKVNIKGWLIFDWEHITDALNTDPDDNNSNNNRAIVWEIHPYTNIEIIQ